jgi:hypothetical protein
MRYTAFISMKGRLPVAKSLFDDIKSAQTTNRSACNVALLIKQLPPTDREGLLAALEDPAIYGSTIVKVLKDRGHRIGDDSVRRHRRGACSCTEERGRIGGAS